MASTSFQRGIYSSSPSKPQWKYEVFLSFYGKDTRLGFTDHLHDALKEKGIVVFRDDEKLERGNNISQELMKAIGESRYAIVVISKNYADSKYCLMELTKMVEATRETQLTIFPVFYHVDPSDVRNQRKSFAEAFTRHGENPEIDEEQRKTWSAALRQVGSISGWHVHRRSEATIVEEISGWIFGKLTHNLPNIYKNLVGIESRIDEIMSLLHMGWDDVRFIGLFGMAGIGKTTLAEVVYDRVCSKFKASCFIACVGEETRKHGIKVLQEQLISRILMVREANIWSSFDGIRMMGNRLRNANVFIVLDDVDSKEQLESLAGSLDWFGEGSRIIITSRDRGLLNGHVNTVYEVEGMNDNEALQLFSLKAFKKPHPEKTHAALSKDIVNYAQGLPLALEVLGSFLYGRSMDEWISARHELEANPNAQILDRLRTSFDGLGDLQKRLFLDIACFFNGAHIDSIMHKLDGFGYYPNINIEVLKEKSLINVSSGRLWMHDLLQKMGQHIVQHQSSRKLGRYSRLWYYEDIIHVLRNNIGTDAIEGIILKLPLRNPEQLTFEAFSRMSSLKMLEISNANREISFSRSRDHLCSLKWLGDPSNFMLSNELCVIEWWGYPLESLPANFYPNNLVELIMRQSCMKQLWHGWKGFEKLKHIDLINSENLIETPDFSGVPHVEELEFAHCTSLYEVHPSIGLLKHLKRLNLSGCRSLKRLPDKISLVSLEDLDLSGCSLLKRFPSIIGNMNSLRSLYLSGTAIKKLPSSFKCLSSLVHFSVSNCPNFKKIPKSIGGMECLERLYADGTVIRELPCSIVSLKKLRVLKVGGSYSNSIGFSLPNSFSGLKSLRELDLSYRNLSDSAMLSNLSCLSLLGTLNLSGNKFMMIPNIFLSSLRKLYLSHCNLLDGAIPNDLSSLSTLWILDLRGNKFTQIPDCVSQLSDLRELYLEDCNQLKALPKLPLRLGYLNLKNCPSLKTFYNKVDASTSRKILRAIDFTFVAVYVDYDDKPYKILHLHRRSPLRIKNEAQIFDSSVACGLAFGLGVPEWFNQTSTSSFETIKRHIGLDLDDDTENWKGYALFIDYRFHEFDIDLKQGKRKKIHEHWDSKPRILDGSNPTFHYFVCQFQTDKVGLREPLVLCVPQVPSVGRNGFWVYIPAEWFGEHGCNLESWSGLEASIVTGSPNVEVNDYGLRLVRQHDFSELYEVLSSISPHGLNLEIWENLFSCLHGDLADLKVQGPIMGNVIL